MTSLMTLFISFVKSSCFFVDNFLFRIMSNLKTIIVSGELIKRVGLSNKRIGLLNKRVALLNDGIVLLNNGVVLLNNRTLLSNNRIHLFNNRTVLLNKRVVILIKPTAYLSFRFSNCKPLTCLNCAESAPKTLLTYFLTNAACANIPESLA